VKLAISLPDELFAQIDRCARRLHLSRSGMLAAAAREFVARHDRRGDATASWDEAIELGGQPGADAAAQAFRRRTKAVVREREARRR
jgi:predicted transcriptional regulator